MTVDLVLIWTAIIGFAVLMYVVLDGFDLGIGVLFPFIKDPAHRSQMMNSIAPIWDGNETWLVMGGVALLAVFPLAYAVILSALYAPLIGMLLALIFRGVAFEFRHRDARHRDWWDMGFAAGSILATFFQGIVLGAFIQGIEIAERGYGGGWFDWMTPFSMFTGVALVMGYALLGAGWLVMKTQGRLQERTYRLMRPLGLAVLAAIGIVSLWTPLLNADIAARWFSYSNLLWLSPVPLLVAAVAVALFRAIAKRREAQPFLLALALFLLSYLGLGISLYPLIIPPDVNIWEAAAPPATLKFMLVGAAILLPIILGYTAHTYWVFRGKVGPDEGYHAEEDHG